MAQADAVLILGGCGHVGRHLVALLVKKGCCQKIRVVDKCMPMMANLAPDHKAAFGSPLVEFKQADLSREAGVGKAFEGITFTHVFNLTFDAIKFGLDDATYQQLVMDVSTRCGMAAAAQGASRFIDLSTAQVYEPSEKGSVEKGAKLKPWTKQATYKLRAEATLRDVPGLNLVVLRAHARARSSTTTSTSARCHGVFTLDPSCHAFAPRAHQLRRAPSLFLSCSPYRASASLPTQAPRISTAQATSTGCLLACCARPCTAT